VGEYIYEKNKHTKKSSEGKMKKRVAREGKEKIVTY
jgi:hypothetical protein